jgi:hypothetical protein
MGLVSENSQPKKRILAIDFLATYECLGRVLSKIMPSYGV